MRRLSKRARRQALYGWLKWTPILALVFSVMFFDAWLNIRTRNNDYEFARVSKEIRALYTDLGDARVKRADGESLPQLASLVPDMGLVKPEPNQVQALYHSGVVRERVAKAPLTLARAPEAVQTSAPESSAPAPVSSVKPVQLAAQSPAPAAPGTGARSDEADEEAKLMGTISIDSPASL